MIEILPLGLEAVQKTVIISNQNYLLRHPILQADNPLVHRLLSNTLLMINASIIDQFILDDEGSFLTFNMIINNLIELGEYQEKLTNFIKKTKFNLSSENLAFANQYLPKKELLELSRTDQLSEEQNFDLGWLDLLFLETPLKKLDSTNDPITNEELLATKNNDFKVKILLNIIENCKIEFNKFWKMIEHHDVIFKKNLFTNKSDNGNTLPMIVAEQYPENFDKTWEEVSKLDLISRKNLLITQNDNNSTLLMIVAEQCSKSFNKVWKETINFSAIAKKNLLTTKNDVGDNILNYVIDYCPESFNKVWIGLTASLEIDSKIGILTDIFDNNKEDLDSYTKELLSKTIKDLLTEVFKFDQESPGKSFHIPNIRKLMEIFLEDKFEAKEITISKNSMTINGLPKKDVLLEFFDNNTNNGKNSYKRFKTEVKLDIDNNKKDSNFIDIEKEKINENFDRDNRGFSKYGIAYHLPKGKIELEFYDEKKMIKFFEKQFGIKSEELNKRGEKPNPDIENLTSAERLYNVNRNRNLY